MKEEVSNESEKGGENIPDVSEKKSETIENPVEKKGVLGRDLDYLGESSEQRSMGSFGGFVGDSRRSGNSGFQELTLSYLCDNGKKGITEKGKEVVVSEDLNEEGNRWVERDFLCLNENRGTSYKREVEGNEGENKKKPRMETLNLSLALPEASLSMDCEFPARLNSIRGGPSSSDNPARTTTTAYSNDFTAASLSYSYSHPYSHNPSCSLTRNSTDCFDYSTGSHRRDWNAGEGTNGSVHSRFRPIGDGTVALVNPGPAGGGVSLVNRFANRDISSSNLYKAASSDNVSFFPSELPARPRWDAQSGSENLDGERAPARKQLSSAERLLREVVSESIPVMFQIVQELPHETVESTKEYLRNLIVKPEKMDELIVLQNRLDRRSDLTSEALSKAHKFQLDILVAIKMGLGAYLSNKICIPSAELVDIFLLERCRNVNCKRLLPVDDCDCKICSTKKGFCSECMCPVCLKFDCAANTCSWVGCDVCSHWCHATCGIEKSLIRPVPSSKGPSGMSEMQFNCLGCGHASEMFGFVKEVYLSCARDWGLETLMKELDCVRRIFRRSEDRKGMELHAKADELLSKLQNKMMSPSDACNLIFQFFNHTDAYPDNALSNIPSKDVPRHSNLRSDVPPLTSVVPKSSFYGLSSSSARKDLLPVDHYQSDLKSSPMNNDDKIIQDEWSVKPLKKDGFDSLESIVVVKEAEARMFQSRADEARREADGFRHMMRIKGEKLEEEYAQKLQETKVCVQETEEKRRKKLEDLKTLENSHCDYYQMKIRMQADIAGLLKRMEATKHMLV